MLILLAAEQRQQLEGALQEGDRRGLPHCMMQASDWAGRQILPRPQAPAHIPAVRLFYETLAVEG